MDIAEIATKAHDLEDKLIRIVGIGRIGQRVCERLKGFDVKIIYYNIHKLSIVEELVLGARFSMFDQLIEECDVITINTALTDGLFNRELFFSMKKGAYLVNCARDKNVDTVTLVQALEEGHLAGYAGDVWFPEPAPKDDP